MTWWRLPMTTKMRHDSGAPDLKCTMVLDGPTIMSDEHTCHLCQWCFCLCTGVWCLWCSCWEVQQGMLGTGPGAMLSDWSQQNVASAHPCNCFLHLRELILHLAPTLTTPKCLSLVDVLLLCFSFSFLLCSFLIIWITPSYQSQCFIVSPHFPLLFIVKGGLGQLGVGLAMCLR